MAKKKDIKSTRAKEWEKFLAEEKARADKAKEVKSKLAESYAAQENRLIAERKAKEKQAPQEESAVSKALYRMSELAEILRDQDDILNATFTVTDAFENKKEAKIFEIFDIFMTLVEEFEPKQTPAGTTSLYDELVKAKAENEKLKEVAAELAAYLPLDRWHQKDLLDDIERDGAATYALDNLPLFFNRPVKKKKRKVMSQNETK